MFRNLFQGTQATCLSTPELVLIANNAVEQGMYSGWRSSLSFIDLRNMINWNVIAQLFSLTLVILSGPAIIFLLYFKQGNL